MRLALRDTNATFVSARKAAGLGPKGSGFAGRVHAAEAGISFWVLWPPNP